MTGRLRPPLFLAPNNSIAMRAVLMLSLLVLAAAAVPGFARDGVYLQADSLSFSDTVPVRGYFNDWRSPFHSGQRALTYNYAEAGVVEGRWSLGVVARYDEYLRFSPDTADLYYRIANHLPLPPGRHYLVDLNARQFAANGLRLGVLLPVRPSLDIGLGLSYLQGTQLTDGTLRGAADVINAMDYNYNLAVDYNYSEDHLFKRQVDTPTGRGYSLDLSMNWRTDKLVARLRVTDLLGRLYWHNAPYTLATATSNTKSYGADGYLIINPTVSGYEGNHSFSQRLPTRAHLDLRAIVTDSIDVVADVYYTDLKTFIPLGLSYHHRGGRTRIQYDWRSGAVTLGYQAPHLTASLTSDRLDWQKARTLGVNLETHLGFD